MYNYQTEKPKLFTESGQELFLKIRDNAARLFTTAKYVDMGDLINVSASGDSFLFMACVDRLVELEQFREVPTRPDTFGQHRIFKRP